MEKPARRKRGCRYWLNLGLFGLAVLWVGYFVVAIYSVTAPVSQEICCATPADEGFDYEAVTLTSPLDVTLSGWYIPSKNGAAVILLHGYDATRLSVLPQALMLAEAGYGVLLYDMRGHGGSSPVVRSYGWVDVVDVETAVTWLQSRDDIDPDRIGIYGFSLGGQVALRAAAELDGIQAVAADGPGLANNDDTPPLQSAIEYVFRFGNGIVFKGVEWRTGFSQPEAIIDTIAGIAPRPLFLIASGETEEMEPRIVQFYYDHAQEPKTIWFIPETGHGGGPKVRPEEYAARLVSFYDVSLLLRE
ncbi:MAG: alpha/beta fold hydrolase [Ardenticatenaceae bacterium]|nr:alpha/beta fold hydrolase [Ardenticatenaceae bacterium]MCB9444202.1 alpha/beta fold hydrolase [Ardenticatenaceae bacterium]